MAASMTPHLTTISMAIRTYGSHGHRHAHRFAQFVLPITGSLEMDIAGKGARLTPGLAAFVAHDEPHAQSAQGLNRFLILDVDSESLSDRSLEQLTRQPFFTLSPAAEHLVHYLNHQSARPVESHHLQHWLSLFLDAVATHPGGAVPRLSALLDRLNARLERAWTVSEMAGFLGISPGRLHTLFRNELSTSPMAWLAERRLEHVRGWLTGTSLSIAEIAGRAGYSDQSALTRAFRSATDFTPGEYRRRWQQLESKKR